jgi:hypothetical protein
MRSTKLLVAAAAALALVGSTAAGPANTASNGSQNTGKPFQVQLDPEQEVGDFSGVEDASGDVSLRLNPGQGQICVDGVIDGFDPALAHIHEAPAGQNGAVVVGFDTLIDGDGFEGCVEVDRDLVRDIIKSPADYYVNVHLGGGGTPEFFQGVRGQLSR